MTAQRRLPDDAAPVDAHLPRPPRRARAPRVSGQLALAAVLGFVAVVGYLISTGGASGRLVAVAAHDLAAGVPVGPGDFTFVSVEADPGVIADLIQRTAVGSLAGQSTIRSIHAGELVRRDALASVTARPRAISIPTEPAHAVAGTLRRGDVVDVVDASGDVAVWVATGVQVLDVGGGDTGRLGTTSSKYAVTVAVSDPQALAVAQAIAGGKVELVRSTGAPAAAVTPTTTVVRR